ncbi:MAG TPA: zf-HC2 domain-containing protein, partial [Bacteroidetes bacterium]|nr:zf-HC2 domain-containing protein [Bacteroidota bacterium]
DWVIQAYINGELDTDEILEFKNHLKICSSCSPRLADRRRRVANVLVLIEELETNPISNRKHKNVPLARVFAATASIAIVFGFLRCYVN